MPPRSPAAEKSTSGTDPLRDLYRVRLDTDGANFGKVVKLCAECLMRIDEGTRRTLTSSAVATGFLGLMLLFVWFLATASNEDLFYGVTRSRAALAQEDLSERLTILGVLAAVAIGISVATGEMAARVEALYQKMVGHGPVDLSVIKSSGTARFLFLGLILLTGSALACSLSILLVLIVNPGHLQEVTVPLSLLLACFLYAQLTFAFETWRGRGWLEAKVSLVRGAGVVRRIRELMPELSREISQTDDRASTLSTPAAMRRWAAFCWVVWWCASSAPGLVVVALARDWVPAVGTVIILACCTAMVRSSGRLFGRDRLVEVGWGRGFSIGAFWASALSIAFIQAVVVSLALDRAGSELGPGSVALVVIAAAADLSLAAVVFRGYAGLGLMRAIAWREVAFVSGPQAIDDAGRTLSDEGAAVMSKLGFWIVTFVALSSTPLIMGLRYGTDFALFFAFYALLTIWLVFHLAAASLRSPIRARPREAAGQLWRFTVSAFGALPAMLAYALVLHDRGVSLVREPGQTLAAAGLATGATLAVAVCLGLTGVGPYRGASSFVHRRQRVADSRLVELVLEGRGRFDGLGTEATEPGRRTCNTPGCEGPTVSL